MRTFADAALEAVAERLTDAIPEVPVETDRRSDVPDEDFPRLVVVDEGDEPDHTQSPGETFYRLIIAVTGYARAYGTEAPDTEARQAVNALRAQVIQALHGYQSPDGVVVDAIEASCDRRIYDADESTLPAGEFTSRWSIVTVTPAGNPWVA